jgi:hypothetical protein
MTTAAAATLFFFRVSPSTKMHLMLPKAIIINIHVTTTATQDPQEHTVGRKRESNKLEEKEGIQYMEFLDMASI